MLIAENKQVKHGLSILQLLGVQLPKKVAMIHCWGQLYLYQVMYKPMKFSNGTYTLNL